MRLNTPLGGRACGPASVSISRAGLVVWVGILAELVALAGALGCRAPQPSAAEPSQAAGSAPEAQVPMPAASPPLASAIPPRASAPVALAPAGTFAGAPGAEAPPPAEAKGVPCAGALCYRFATAQAAVQFLLAQRPRVVALGEAHAQADANALEPTVRRFQRELLPLFAQAGARALVVELLSPAANCSAPVTNAREVEREVTVSQRKENKNDYVELGHAANKLGVTPFILEPSCESYQAVLDAGDARVEKMLELIATETQGRLTRFLRRGAAGAPLLLAYGGALHNDVRPRAGRESWTFGPALVAETGNRYIELDLVSPAQIGTTPGWTEQPWYAPFMALESGAGVVLVEYAPGGFALFFERKPPESVPPSPAASTPAAAVGAPPPHASGPSPR